MEIDKFEGDLFWNDEDTENTCEPEEELDNVGKGDIVEFQQAKSLPHIFGVIDKDDKARFFTTMAEAEAVAQEIR